MNTDVGGMGLKGCSSFNQGKFIAFQARIGTILIGQNP